MIFVKLGELLFNGAEVPEKINLGGKQMTAVHQLIGGLRIVDTLGRNDDEITFKGLFRGVLSLERVSYLNGLRIKGEQVLFTYGIYSYNVIVSDFKANQEIAYQIYYDIRLTIVQDLTKPVSVAVPISFSDAILGAYIEALDIATFLKEGGILGALGLLGGILSNIPDLNNPTISQITALTTAIATATVEVSEAIKGQS